MRGMVGGVQGLGLCMGIKWGHSTSETLAIVRGCALYNIVTWLAT